MNGSIHYYDKSNYVKAHKNENGEYDISVACSGEQHKTVDISFLCDEPNQKHIVLL